MARGRLLHRLVTLVAWTSPLLLLVLVFGVGTPRVTHSNAAPTPNVLSSSLASSIRGRVGAHVHSVVVPLATTRPWMLHTSSAVHGHLQCGQIAFPVHDVVTAPNASCVLVLSSTSSQSHEWTLDLLP